MTDDLDLAGIGRVPFRPLGKVHSAGQMEVLENLVFDPTAQRLYFSTGLFVLQATPN